MSCKRIQRLVKLIAATILPCLQKRIEAKEQERIKDETERIKRFLNREWRMIKTGHGEHEDGSFFHLQNINTRMVEQQPVSTEAVALIQI